jgi:hypothetical protein
MSLDPEKAVGMPIDPPIQSIKMTPMIIKVGADLQFKALRHIRPRPYWPNRQGLLFPALRVSQR